MSHFRRVLAPLVLVPALAGLAVPAASLASAGAGVAALPVGAAAAGIPEVVDTVGTDFWTAIPAVVSPLSPKTLYVSPTADGTVTISKADGTVVATETLTAGQVKPILLPNDSMVAEDDGVGSKGLHVVASAPVSVYGTIIQAAASTGYQAYPTEALGTRYRVLGYTGLGYGMGTRVTVLSPQDDTTVTITPKSTVRSRAAGAAFQVELDKGQTYQLTGDQAVEDTTGSLVTSDKPVAVFGGAICTNIPVGYAACNPILAQMTPTPSWGKEFVSSRLAGRAKGDTYRVLADADGTAVSVNGVLKDTIDAGEHWEAVLPEGVTTSGPGGVQIETSKPALVAQYSNGTLYDGTNGDPMMTLVPPVGQLLTRYVVAAPSITGSAAMQPYLSIVARTVDVGQVLLNDVAIPANEFTALAGTPYSVLSKTVPAGQYSLKSPGRVGITVFELGNADGFMFPGGHGLASIADAPPPPTAGPLTSSGPAPSITVPLQPGQGVELVDGPNAGTTVSKPGQGTYTLDQQTGTITFTPDAGFSGTADPVTYRIRDAYNQSAESTFSATVQSLPPAPTASPATSTGQGPQSTTVTVPTGGTISLVDGSGNASTQITVPEGTYTLDPATGTISFVPRPGFTGTASAVTFRITDSYNRTSDATYVATVSGTVTPTPPSGGLTGSMALSGLQKIALGRTATLPVTCRTPASTLRTCTVTLTAVVNGTRAVVGTGTWNGATGRVSLNAVGRTVVSQPGGLAARAEMVGKTADGRRVTATAPTTLVGQRFTLARRVLFGTESAALRKGDRTWLRSLRSEVGSVERVICIGHTDSRGSQAYNTKLSRKRAANACSAIGLPRGVKVTVAAEGKKSPAASNATAQGRQLNRRVTITLVY